MTKMTPSPCQWRANGSAAARLVWAMREKRAPLMSSAPDAYQVGTFCSPLNENTV